VKYHLDAAGYELNTQKICTVRLSRKVLPGYSSYSLGKLTQLLGITHTQRHRAGGDALATADLLAMIVAKDDNGAIKGMLKGRNTEQYLPPHLPLADIEQLPPATGVYYFYNNAGKVIYVGKARNIRKRVKSHFSNNKVNRQKQDFLKETHKISYKRCATELMAHILESTEIRKLWPIHNRSQKGYLPLYGMYCYQDLQGYERLAVERTRPSAPPIFSFNSLIEGQSRLREMVNKFKLCPRMCNLAKVCECPEHEAIADYNEKTQQALAWLKQTLPTFVLLDNGIDEGEQSCILIQNGNFAGMGYITDRKTDLVSIEVLKQRLEAFQDNDFIRNLVYRHAEQFPYKCVAF
jgi:DNA polymerase-3 subunit epsilon